MPHTLRHPRRSRNHRTVSFRGITYLDKTRRVRPASRRLPDAGAGPPCCPKSRTTPPPPQPDRQGRHRRDRAGRDRRRRRLDNALPGSRRRLCTLTDPPPARAGIGRRAASPLKHPPALPDRLRGPTPSRSLGRAHRGPTSPRCPTTAWSRHPTIPAGQFDDHLREFSLAAHDSPRHGAVRLARRGRCGAPPASAEAGHARRRRGGIRRRPHRRRAGHRARVPSWWSTPC